MSSLT
jgi:hypothetical protein